MVTRPWLLLYFCAECGRREVEMAERLPYYDSRTGRREWQTWAECPAARFDGRHKYPHHPWFAMATSTPPPPLNPDLVDA